jgi:uncharacterized membrane protein
MVDLRTADPNRVFSPPVEHRASVGASREIEIDADAAVVWDILTAFDRWPEWNPEITSVSMSGPAAVGVTFRWGDELVAITSTIRRFEPQRRIEWTSRALGATVRNDWHVQPHQGTTLVREYESLDGLVARLLRRPLQKSLQRWLGNGLHHLKVEAERRASAEREGPS